MNTTFDAATYDDMEHCDICGDDHETPDCLVTYCTGTWESIEDYDCDSCESGDETHVTPCELTPDELSDFVDAMRSYEIRHLTEG